MIMKSDFLLPYGVSNKMRVDIYLYSPKMIIYGQDKSKKGKIIKNTA